MIIKPVFSSDVAITNDYDNNNNPESPFLILGNLMVVSVSPHEPVLMLNPAANACACLSLPPVRATTMGSLPTPHMPQSSTDL